MVDDPVDLLEHELVAAARRQAELGARASSKARRWWSGRTLAVVVLGVLGTGGAAYAASQALQTGAPVAYPSGRPAKADAGLGVPVTGTAKLLALRADDPAGGPQWGLRVLHTTRGYGCLQLGRIVDGRVGLLGEDGSFGDDGRFHELRAGVLSRQDRQRCVPLDSTGHAHLALHDTSIPASGHRDCAATPLELSARGGPKPCPKGSLRSIDVGFAGPDATQITYRTPHGPRTQRVEGADGAYLVVQTAPDAKPIPPGRPTAYDRTSYVIGATPGAGAISRVDYRDGSVCIVKPAVQAPGGCRAHGPVVRAVALPLTATVRSPVHLRLVRRDGRLVFLTSFVARVAATGTASAYYLLIELPDWKKPRREGRMRCNAGIGMSIDHDIRAGEHVHQATRLDVAPCTGTYRVRLQYRVASTGARVGGAGQLRYPGRDVGFAHAHWSGT